MSKNESFSGSGRVIKFRYKISKLTSLLPLPTTSKKVLSEYEDRHFRQSFYRNLWQNAARNLGFSFQDLGYGYWRITDDTGRYARGNINGVELDTAISLLISGNKPLVHSLAKDISGYQFADYCEFDLESINLAYAFLGNANGPCVVKPARDTGAGSGVTMNVTTASALIKAAINASLWSKKLMIEKTVSGHSFRILVLGDKYLHAIRRDPPQVAGDGKSTIRELIKQENIRRLEAKDIVSLFPIVIDQECRNTLHASGYQLDSIPENNTNIIVKSVINQNSAQQNHDISDKVHPEIIRTAIEASKRIGLILSGVDVITNDISIPLQESGGVINEINGNPGLHHHYLISQKQDSRIAEAIIQYCLEKNGAV